MKLDDSVIEKIVGNAYPFLPEEEHKIVLELRMIEYLMELELVFKEGDSSQGILVEYGNADL